MKRLIIGVVLAGLALPATAKLNSTGEKLWSDLSYCAGFSQAVAIDKTGSIENFAELWATGNVTDAVVNAGIEFNRYKQGAFNLKGYMNDKEFNRGGMEAGDLIMTGRMGTQGRMTVRQCRSLPSPALQKVCRLADVSWISSMMATNASRCLNIVPTKNQIDV
ncbi:hypothetical protein SP38_132 [Salmonella phage 38]|uniref:Uncharacterized protein n=1 Tax=Salmonella phage 38 TaxID=1654891 RepID=A0A0N7CE92_9CAUD|nr:hypothetical protein SP38_132 [Salmonella phage 38]AKJ73734.1 hypothetical protein SP38_132 [Salmonella phage 38]